MQRVGVSLAEQIPTGQGLVRGGQAAQNAADGRMFLPQRRRQHRKALGDGLSAACSSRPRRRSRAPSPSVGDRHQCHGASGQRDRKTDEVAEDRRGC